MEVLLWILAITLVVTPTFFCPKKALDGFILPQIGVLAVGMSVASLWLAQAGVFPSSPLVGLVLIFMFYLFLTSFWATVPQNATRELPAVFGMCTAFIVASLLFNNPSNMVLISLVVFAVLMATSIYGLGQKMGHDPIFKERLEGDGEDYSKRPWHLVPRWFQNKGFKDTRPISTIGNTNFFSGFLVAGLPFIFFLGVVVSPWFFLSVPIIVATVMAAKCRGAMLGILVSLFLFVVFISKRGWVFDLFNAYVIPLPVGVQMGIALYLFGFCVQAYMGLQKSAFWKRVKDPADPLANMLSFENEDQEDIMAHLRYRFRFWRAAIELIQQKPLQGFGLRSYRKEVYQAQSKLHNHHDNNFLGPGYQTPQPREVHNDYLEYFVEGGLPGGLLFMTIIGVVLYQCHSVMVNASIGNYEYLLISGVVASLFAVMVHAFFFFPFRLASSGVLFWVALALVASLTGRTDVVHFTPNLWVILFLVLILGALIWEGVLKPNLGNYFYSKYAFTGDVEMKERHLLKARELCPKESIFNSASMMGYMHVFPEVAEKHAELAYRYYDGMIPEWSMYLNLGTLRLLNRKIDEAAEMFENSLNSNPRFGPAREQLMRVAPYLKLPKRRIKMKKVSEECMNSLRFLKSESEKIGLAMENTVLKEKLKMNIPFDWMCDTEAGLFMTPQEAEELMRKKQVETK